MRVRMVGVKMIPFEVDKEYSWSDIRAFCVKNGLSYKISQVDWLLKLYKPPSIKSIVVFTKHTTSTYIVQFVGNLG